jgi:hypothetical protein
MDANLRNVLMEEYERKVKNRKFYRKKLNALPKGSLVEKKRNDHSYFYLAYREDGKVVTKYVKAAELDDLKKSIAKRNSIKSQCKSLSKHIDDLEKILKLNKVNQKRKTND